MTIKSLLKKTVLYREYRKFIDHKARRDFEKRNGYFKSEGSDLLCHFSSVLNDNHISFWLEFGTLLGFYREHDFIAHDLDLDVGAFLGDAEKIQTVLLGHGFKLKRMHRAEDGGREDTYIWKHTTIDVFYFRIENGLAYCNSFRLLKEKRMHIIRKKYPCTVRRIDIPNIVLENVEYKSAKVFVPKDTIIHLKAHYGENFMTPDPRFDCKQATNITYYSYDQKKGYRIYY